MINWRKWWGSLHFRFRPMTSPVNYNWRLLSGACHHLQKIKLCSVCCLLNTPEGVQAYRNEALCLRKLVTRLQIFSGTDFMRKFLYLSYLEKHQSPSWDDLFLLTSRNLQCAWFHVLCLIKLHILSFSFLWSSLSELSEVLSPRAGIHFAPQ